MHTCRLPRAGGHAEQQDKADLDKTHGYLYPKTGKCNRGKKMTAHTALLVLLNNGTEKDGTGLCIPFLTLRLLLLVCRNPKVNSDRHGSDMGQWVCINLGNKTCSQARPLSSSSWVALGYLTSLGLSLHICKMWILTPAPIGFSG